ncbi:MAG: T9SS type A sorting domain-containing protein [Brumimicrobium sp.]
MKRNKLFIGGIGVIAVAASIMVVQSFGNVISSKYTSDRGSLSVDQDANGFREWLKGTMIDIETGEQITRERLQEVMKKHKANQTKAITVNWTEHGPDNIGGRTRAILIDHTDEDQNVIWAGGVSGGLYKSTNKANKWYRVKNFPGNQFISSIAQDADGNVYVATGSNDEDWAGNGLFVSPDGGDTWELVPDTDSEDRINRVAATGANSTVYFTTGSGGLKEYTYGGTVSSVSSYGGSGAETLSYSADGDVLVVAASNNRTWVSLDWGGSFEDVSGNDAGDMGYSGFSRIEYAISNKKEDNKYSIYAATSSSNNQGQWISLDNGSTWHEHTPATPANDPSGVIDYRDQGTYNNVVSFDPTDPERVIVGGIDLHEWKQVINNPPSGGWNKISIWNANVTSPLYVHADNHELKWDKNDRLYIGNDGGIGISTDLAQTFYHANRGYNVTQFYSIGYDKNGAVIGGTQDNGCLYNDHTNSTYQEFRRATGGDGFTTEISFFNPDIIFTSSQFNSLNRSGDGGVTYNDFDLPADAAGGNHPFHTQFHFAEYYDENSEDSVVYVPLADYSVGDIVKVPSLATGDTIDYITPNELYFDDTLYYDPSLTEDEYIVTDDENHPGEEFDLGMLSFYSLPSASGNYPPDNGDSLVVELPSGAEDTVVVDGSTAYDYYFGSNSETGEVLDMGIDTVALGVSWDTITVQDPYQSWFVFSTTFGSNSEIWGTRNAARLSTNDVQWVKIADGIGGNQIDVSFSRDLNHMFVTGGSSIYRIDSLGSVYTSDDDFVEKTDIDEGATATNKVTVQSGQFVGIGLNPYNADDLVAVQQFGGNVYRSSNATSASPSMTSVGSQGGIAFYDVIIDRDDNDILMASTYNGASLSEDGGATWTDVSDPGFEGVPSYEIRQSWRTWEDGNRRPGEVYLGTFGRGIWSTDAVLNVSENDPIAEKKKKESNLEVFPNPSRYNSTLVVDLESSNKLDIQFYNISGRMVKRIEKTNASVGRNEIVFSASDLPQGTYIIRVQSGDQIESTKFIRM